MKNIDARTQVVFEIQKMIKYITAHTWYQQL